MKFWYSAREGASTGGNYALKMLFWKKVLMDYNWRYITGLVYRVCIWLPYNQEKKMSNTLFTEPSSRL